MPLRGREKSLPSRMRDEPLGTDVGMLLRSLEELFHPVLLANLLNGAGQRLGRDTALRYRASRKKNKKGPAGSPTPMDFARAMSACGLLPTEAIEVTSNLVRFAVLRFSPPDHDHLAIPLVSGLFGSAAANLFGAGRVVVHGDGKRKRLVVTVGLGRFALSWTEGDGYTAHTRRAPASNRRRR